MLFHKLDKMHGLNTSRTDVTSQVEFGLKSILSFIPSLRQSW